MTKTASDILSDALYHWSGDLTLEDLAKEWANCRHAEVHEGGEVYIEDPQAGHYLGEDKAAQFVDWLRERGHMP